LLPGSARKAVFISPEDIAKIDILVLDRMMVVAIVKIDVRNGDGLRVSSVTKRRHYVPKI
jgi:hypothetical protein